MEDEYLYFALKSYFLNILTHLNTSALVVVVSELKEMSRKERLKRMRLFCLNQALITRPRLPNKHRSDHWWQSVVLKSFNDEDWLENFRMRKETFFFICDKLREELTPKPNHISKKSNVVDVDKKVGISLYYLASCCEYRIVGNQFGLHKSTICVILHEFVTAVNKILLPEYISFPNDIQAKEIASNFSTKSHIPNIIGAIDGSHIPILPPSDGYRDFVNRKGWPSMVLQGVVDHTYRFIDISIKNPGATHDAAVFASSSIFKNIKKLTPKETVELMERKLPYVIIGDPTYPLLPWLLKNFIDRGLTPEEDSFNAHLNSARVSVEIAFGRLKSRWRCLLKRLDVHHSFTPHIVATCCCLHNIVEVQKESFSKKWLQLLKDVELFLEQPPAEFNESMDEYAGYDIRIFLTEYLSENFPLKTSKAFLFT